LSALGTHVAAQLLAHRTRHGLAATISRNSPAADSQGGQTDSWASAGTDTVSFGPVGSGAEREIAARLSAVVAYSIGLSPTSDVTARDRIVIGCRTFEVAGVVASSIAAGKVAGCFEVT